MPEAFSVYVVSLQILTLRGSCGLQNIHLSIGSSGLYRGAPQ